ncbi:MAG: hypothetical protein AB8I08_40615 [Sandaracinaceae bacterium]
MRTRVPKTRRTWLLIALGVVISLVITMLEASGREPRRAAPDPAPIPAATPPTDVVEVEFTE